MEKDYYDIITEQIEKGYLQEKSTKGGLIPKGAVIGYFKVPGQLMVEPEAAKKYIDKLFANCKYTGRGLEILEDGSFRICNLELFVSFAMGCECQYLTNAYEFGKKTHELEETALPDECQIEFITKDGGVFRKGDKETDIRRIRFIMPFHAADNFEVEYRHEYVLDPLKELPVKLPHIADHAYVLITNKKTGIINRFGDFVRGFDNMSTSYSAFWMDELLWPGKARLEQNPVETLNVKALIEAKQRNDNAVLISAEDSETDISKFVLKKHTLRTTMDDLAAQIPDISESLRKMNSREEENLCCDAYQYAQFEYRCYYEQMLTKMVLENGAATTVFSCRNLDYCFNELRRHPKKYKNKEEMIELSVYSISPFRKKPVIISAGDKFFKFVEYMEKAGKLKGPKKSDTYQMIPDTGKYRFYEWLDLDSEEELE